MRRGGCHLVASCARPGSGIRDAAQRVPGRLLDGVQRSQFARETSTRLSEKDGAWPMSVKAPDEMLFTVPSLSWRQ